MPVKSFSIPLSDEDVLHVRIVIEQRAVVDYAVRYEAIIEHRAVQLVLCDGSHGRGHCHRLDEKGEKIDRTWARDGLSLGDAVTEQLDDLAAT